MENFFKWQPCLEPCVWNNSIMFQVNFLIRLSPYAVPAFCSFQAAAPTGSARQRRTIIAPLQSDVVQREGAFRWEGLTWCIWPNYVKMGPVNSIFGGGCLWQIWNKAIPFFQFGLLWRWLSPQCWYLETWACYSGSANLSHLGIQTSQFPV